MRVKEKIIIASIFIITIILALLPPILAGSKASLGIEESTTTDGMIAITIKGEVNIAGEELILEMPVGVSYGDIIRSISAYLNKYSIIDGDMRKCYYEDTAIIIGSKRDGPSINDNSNTNNGNKVNINTATKEELMGIKWIGESRANKIIEYRSKKKIESFQELKDLLRISDAYIKDIEREAIL